MVQAPVLLAFPDLILDKNDSFNTMLWNYSQAKDGVDFLFSENLWIFRKKLPLTFGLSNDGWMKANKSVMIVCPTGSKKVIFHAWRPEGWQQSKVSVRYTGKRDLLTIKNGEIQLVFKEGKPVVLLEGSDFEKSCPVIPSGDTRQLVMIIDNISCDEVGKANQKHLLADSSSIELNVSNWGPQSAKIGTIPNEQPDGSMGIWIKASGAQGLGEAQVLFAGQPAKSTSIQEELITAAITSDRLAVAGDHEIVVKHIGTGKIFPVGIFKVTDQ